MMEWFRRKTEYMDWKNYSARVNFMDVFNWQQSVRLRNIGGK